MASYVARIAVRNLLSPYGLAFVSFAIFLIAWLAPPSMFMNYATEPDILYLNFQVLLFYASCVALFLAGVRLFDFFKPSPGPALVQHDLYSSAPLTFLLLPLIVSTALCAASVIVLNGKVSNLTSLVFSQQGALIKLVGASGQAEEGSWGYALTLHTGVLWWAWSRVQQFSLRASSSWIFRSCFIVAFAVGLFTALIKVDRTNLIPILTGIFLISLYRRLTSREASLTRLLALSVTLAAAVLGTFLAFSYIRGASDLRLLSMGIFGYTAASYNRLAAEVTGLLHYSFGGRGIYLSNFVSFNNTVNRIIPFNEWMGSPTQRGVYFSEFSSIAAGGLNPAFNWSGAFGYIYADLGWWTPLYLFATGILNGYLWREFRQTTLKGIVLYPWTAFSILFWFGWNILFDIRFALLVVAAAGLGLYEMLMLGEARVTSREPVPAAA